MGPCNATACMGAGYLECMEGCWAVEWTSWGVHGGLALGAPLPAFVPCCCPVHMDVRPVSVGSVGCRP
jgi:hypothetical protein